LKTHKPEEQIAIEYRHRDDIKLGMLTLKEDPKWIVELNETAGLPVTEEMKKFRSDWLGSKIK
jgi:hypothetical protein